MSLDADAIRLPDGAAANDDNLGLLEHCQGWRINRPKPETASLMPAALSVSR